MLRVYYLGGPGLLRTFLHFFILNSVLNLDELPSIAYNGKTLGISLVLCSFSRMIVGFPLGPTSLTIGSCCINCIRCVLFLVEQTLDLMRKWLVTPIMFMPIIASVGISCQAGHYCILQNTQIDSIYGYFSSPVKYARHYES